MKVKYFHDTGTALIEFSTHEVVETKEINENIYIDLDSTGNIVSITVEHANLQSNLPNLYYEQIGVLEPQQLHEKPNSSVKYE